jgi:uncharacterized protein (TIGR02271 family)
MQQATGVNVSAAAAPHCTREVAGRGETKAADLNEALERSGGAAAVVPVIADELNVGRRSVETGRVRVSKLVSERQEVVDQPTVTEQVTVERVPVNRVVEQAPAPRQEGDTLVVPVVEEVVVVQRRLVLKEEVRITRTRTESRDPQTVTLRSEDVRVERIGADGEPKGT